MHKIPVGPDDYRVGSPVLSGMRFAEGALALGIIASGGLMALFSIVIGVRREIREMGGSESRND